MPAETANSKTTNDKTTMVAYRCQRCHDFTFNPQMIGATRVCEGCYLDRWHDLAQPSIASVARNPVSQVRARLMSLVRRALKPVYKGRSLLIDVEVSIVTRRLLNRNSAWRALCLVLGAQASGLSLPDALAKIEELTKSYSTKDYYFVSDNANVIWVEN